MPSRQGKAARQMEQQVWARAVQLPDGKGGFATASCIVARETSSPAAGCKVEALQLGDMDRIERAVVMYMIVVWRIARLMRLGRSCPDLDAALMFEKDEWQAAYILNKEKLPGKPPSLNAVIRLVARLGGFLARKGDGEPGVQTIWLGMQGIIDFAAGIKFSRELLAQGSCV
ncbi:MAG: IS4 family transposase [Pseudomonadota bacterium]